MPAYTAMLAPASQAEVRRLAIAPAGVVTVSSGAQSMGQIDVDNLQGIRDYAGQRRQQPVQTRRRCCANCLPDTARALTFAADTVAA